MKKTKRIVCAIVILLIVIIVIFFLKISSNKENKILVYVNSDKELKYIVSSDRKPILLSKSFDEAISLSYNKNKDSFLYIKDKSLYLVNIENNTNDKIGVQVDQFNFIGEKVYYLDSEKNLYIYEGNDKKRLDDKVSDILYNDDYILIYSKDNNAYYYNLKSDSKELILKNLDNQQMYIDEKDQNIIYIGNDGDSSNLYNYNIKTKKTNIKAKDINKIISMNEDFSKIIYSAKKESKAYENIIDDSMLESDKNNTNTCYYYYDSFYDTYYYYDEHSIIHIVTKEEYDTCPVDSKNIALRDKIREQLSSNSSFIYYDVYEYEDGETNLIAENVSDILYSSIDKDNVIYKSYTFESTQKIDISDISSIDQLNEILSNYKSTLYYSSKNNDALPIIASKSDIEEVFEKDNNIYYRINNGEENEFYRFNLKSNKSESIGKNVLIIDKDTKQYGILYLSDLNNENNEGDLVSEKNNEFTIVEDDISKSAVYLNDTLFYYKNFDSKNKNGDFIIYNPSKNNIETLNDVSDVLYINKNDYFVLKDYSRTDNSYSLFMYSNKKYSPIEYNIISYQYSK